MHKRHDLLCLLVSVMVQYLFLQVANLFYHIFKKLVFIFWLQLLELLLDIGVRVLWFFFEVGIEELEVKKWLGIMLEDSIDNTLLLVGKFVFQVSFAFLFQSFLSFFVSFFFVFQIGLFLRLFLLQTCLTKLQFSFLNDLLDIWHWSDVLNVFHKHFDQWVLRPLCFFTSVSYLSWLIDNSILILFGLSAVLIRLQPLVGQLSFRHLAPLFFGH